MGPLTLQEVAGQISEMGQVPVPHTGDARYAMDSAGRRWVRKLEAVAGADVIRAEALGWLVSRLLKAPVPDGAVATQAPRAWLSEYLPDVVSWEDGYGPRIANKDEFAAMLVGDVLLLNEDRHERNILVRADKQGTLQVWSIDLGGAWIGSIHTFIEKVEQDALPSTAALAVGIPFRDLAQKMRKVAAEAAAIPASELTALAREGCKLFQSDATALGSALVDRFSAAEGLIEMYLQHVGEDQ